MTKSKATEPEVGKLSLRKLSESYFHPRHAPQRCQTELERD
jgi:hypothetical protein